MVIEAVCAHAREFPEKLAVVHEDGSWTWAAFASRIDEARGHVAGAGLDRDTLAILCLSALPVAWAYALAFRSLGISVMAAADLGSLATLPLPGDCCLVSLDGATPSSLSNLARRRGWRTLRVRPLQGATGTGLAIAAGTRLGDQVLMTSGTTGTYKLVRRAAAADLASVPASAAAYGLGKNSVAHVGNFPLWTAGGYRWALAAWHAGATVVFDQRSVPQLSFSGVRLTHLFATPATLAWLLGAPETALRRDDDMRVLVTAGAMPRVVADAAQERLSRQLVAVLASTEALTIGMTPVEGPEDLRWHRILPSRKVEVVDETDAVLPPGAVGQIRVRIEDGLRGYLGDEATTRRFFRGGCFYPGDLGEFRADGRLALHGRLNDVVSVLGDKVATGPIEQAIQDRLRVGGACVLSLPSANGDEEIHVVIQAGRPLARSTLESLAQRELRMFPAVHFHVLERLPRNAMGKVLRAELCRQLQAQQGAAGTPKRQAPDA